MTRELEDKTWQRAYELCLGSRTQRGIGAVTSLDAREGSGYDSRQQGGAQLIDASNSETPLKASFKIKLNGEPVIIATVGQAYRLITSLSPVEWMEFRSLHADARAALEAAAENAMLNVQATKVLRLLFARAKLL